MRNKGSRKRWHQRCRSKSCFRVPLKSIERFPRTPYSMARVCESRSRACCMLVTCFLAERSPYLAFCLRPLILTEPRPPTLEHFPFLPYPFEFPRPFEVFEGGPFSTEASSETPSNTFFAKGQRCSRCSRVGAVLAKPKHRAIGWPLGVIYVLLDPPKPS